MQPNGGKKHGVEKNKPQLKFFNADKKHFMRKKNIFFFFLKSYCTKEVLRNVQDNNCHNIKQGTIFNKVFRT